MECSHVTLIAAVLLTIFTISTAERCPCPPEPEGGLTLVSDNKYEDDYKKGSIIVWECKNGKGFGNVFIECKSNGEWTDVNKKCKEQIPFNFGSLAGIICAAFTLTVQITFVLLATKMLKKKEDDEDVELRIMEANKGTANDKK